MIGRGMGVAMVAVLLAGGTAAIEAQVWQRSDDGWCDEDWGGRDQERACMVMSSSLDDPGMLVIDGGMNGGVEVQGWNGSQVEVRAKVWANARSESRADELADAVEIEWNSGRLSADGPETDRRESWGVSWEVRVPFDTDLDIETQNGGIEVTDVGGEIRFDAQNGGVRLDGVSGDVEGQTTNGALHITLDGERWSGAGMDVATVNGGVTMDVPNGYSARLETGTVNGGIDVDFPVTVRGRIGKSLEANLGEGGATVRAVTTNGGVKIRRSGNSSPR